MREIFPTSRFVRDVRRMRKRGRDEAKLQAVIQRLANDESLEPRYRDHQLTGNLADFRECHIEPDWLLVYRFGTVDDTPALILARTGTHSDLFG